MGTASFILSLLTINTLSFLYIADCISPCVFRYDNRLWSQEDLITNSSWSTYHLAVLSSQKLNMWKSLYIFNSDHTFHHSRIDRIKHKPSICVNLIDNIHHPMKFNFNQVISEFMLSLEIIIDKWVTELKTIKLQ